jgi:hypothetical protein
MSARAGWMLVVAGTVAWAAILVPLHDVLPMWVEGLPAYVDQLLGVLRRACTPPVHAIAVGGRAIPLAIDAYQGPLMTYVDVPVARAWLAGLVDDPYAYRYKGIALLALAGLLAYPLLLRVAPPRIAAPGALLLVTLPVVSVTAIADLQYHVVLLCAVIAIVLPLVRYAESGAPRWLVVAAFFAGLSLLTRAEVLVWSAAAILAWTLLERRALLVQAGRALLPARWIGVVAAFALGAAPVLLFNVVAPRYGLAAFVLGGGANAADGLQLLDTLAIRLRHFAGFVLLHRFGLYEVRVPHVVFAALAGTAIVASLVAALRTRRWPLALVAIAVVLPLSVVANRGPRDIHLLPLVVPVVVLVAAMAARLPRRAGVALMTAAVGANVVMGALVLLGWQALRDEGVDSVPTGSCPACLAAAIERHAPAQVLFTQLGGYAEALWASRARICGRDVHRNVELGEAVARAVEGAGTKVFVAVPAEREALLVRTGRGYARADALAAALASTGVAVEEEPVRDARGRELYRLHVVRDDVPDRFAVSAAGFNAPRDGEVTGYVLGRGFRESDIVAIDGEPVRTTFGGPGLLTFVVEAARLPARRTYGVAVQRGADRTARVDIARP